MSHQTKEAKLLTEDLLAGVARAKARREAASPDGRAAHQEVPRDLVEAIADAMTRIETGGVFGGTYIRPWSDE
jgi:hypothetical protein